MSVSEGTSLVNNKNVKVRLHCHQHPDPKRSEYHGGPEGHGYIEGPMDDIKYLSEQKPPELVIKNKDGVPLETLCDIIWQEADVMWDRDDYIHGIVHLEWK